MYAERHNGFHPSVRLVESGHLDHLAPRGDAGPAADLDAAVQLALDGADVHSRAAWLLDETGCRLTPTAEIGDPGTSLRPQRRCCYPSCPRL